MPIYRIADLPIAYTPQSAYVTALLKDCPTADAPALSLTVTPSMRDAEAAQWPDATDGQREAAALLRALGQTLPRFDRLLLHAAAVVFDGKAYAFVAPSGVGKTTHARLWTAHLGDRAAVLSGDRLILDIRDSGVIAHGIPWRGKEGLGTLDAVPLGGIAVLSRADRSHAAPLAPTDALPHLWRALPRLPSADAQAQVLTLLERLTAAVPLYRLQATPSVDAVDAMLSVFGGTR